ncbi:MAG: response regulator transcription factor [Nitrospirae bacterium]|nr:response regulator transcription factor [Nitrospirota bacterium]
MAKGSILIVEDDTDIAEMLSYNLRKEGFDVSVASNGEESLEFLKDCRPQLIILDLMLPLIDGYDVCRAIRSNEETSIIPVIMLTAKSRESDMIAGFELGADDYITKPFSPKELIARVRAVLRRFDLQLPGGTIKIGDISIDTVRHKATVLGAPIQLTYTEFRLLAYMAQRPGVVLPRNKILSDVFDYQPESYDRSVDNHIKTLRKKLGDARDYIETIRGVGYSFRDI